jgi:hypothetical protein
MPCKIKNPANIDLSDMKTHINGMYDYFDQKLAFQKPPVMVFDSDPSNQANVLGKTAYYDPSSLEVHVFTDGRHPKDMLRSIAHELIHHHQNLEGRLDVGGYMGEGYYLKNEKMKALEDEAMEKGNGLMREYEDNLKLGEKTNMSLKEWKNNELNKLLLKRWGILSEAKKPDADGDGVPDWADKKEGDDSEKDLDEGRMNPRTTNSDKFTGHEDRYQPDRIHESEEEKANKEKDEEQLYRYKNGKIVPVTKEFMAGRRMRKKIMDLLGLKEEEVSEAKEKFKPGKKFDKKNANKMPKKGKKYDNDPKPPKGGAPAAAEEEEKIAALQEALKRIAKAKRVFLNNKRIK